MFASTKGSIAVLTFFFVNTYGTPYTLDIVDMQSNTTTPKAMEINLRSVQPKRGVFALSGCIDFKVDINTDRAKGEIKVLYSSNGISYQATPFRMRSTSVTNMFNNPSIRGFLNSLEKCCTGAAISNPFVSPLTKRIVKCENCLYPKDIFPSGMQPGYYKQIILIDDLPIIDLAVTILVKLELDN